MIPSLLPAHSSRLRNFSLLIVEHPVCAAFNAIPSHTFNPKVRSYHVRPRADYVTPPSSVSGFRTRLRGQAASSPRGVSRPYQLSSSTRFNLAPRPCCYTRPRSIWVTQFYKTSRPFRRTLRRWPGLSGLPPPRRLCATRTAKSMPCSILGFRQSAASIWRLLTSTASVFCNSWSRSSTPVKLALAENITLRFDVLMLAIVSRDYCVEH